MKTFLKIIIINTLAYSFHVLFSYEEIHIYLLNISKIGIIVYIRTNI